ncbi:MAG: hypothetical protein ACYC1K_02655 [Minisyncoccota bacterium]
MPKILIEYNRFLDPIFVASIQSQQRWKDWKPAPLEEVLEKVEAYKKEWAEYGPKIMNALYDVTGLNFNREVIEVYIVSGNLRQFSNPIVIKSGFSSSEFVDVLTHELIHRLFTLNSLKKRLIISEKYLNESDLVRNHILLHALLKYIYLDILNEPERLSKNVSRSKAHSTSDYIRTWEIVEIEGYMNIINEFVHKLKTLPV